MASEIADYQEKVDTLHSTTDSRTN